MKKNHLTVLKNKYYLNLSSKMGIGMTFLLLGASPLSIANAEVKEIGFTHEEVRQAGFLLKGVVKDIIYEPLIGVNVLVKGTATGAFTDLDGNISVNVKNGDVLVISYTGYATQEFVVKDSTPLNVTLEEDLTELGEVVVSALGIK